MALPLDPWEITVKSVKKSRQLEDYWLVDGQITLGVSTSDEVFGAGNHARKMISNYRAHCLEKCGTELKSYQVAPC